MGDCPRCKHKLAHLPSGRKNKALRERMKRRFKSDIKIRIIGDTRPQTKEGLNMEPPDGMKVIERCGSCAWTSERTYVANNPEGKKWVYKVS